MKRGLLVALVVAWSSTAAAQSITMSPNPVNVGDVLLGQSGSATGRLSSTENIRVSLQLGNCLGGGGTFTFNKTSDINLNNPQDIEVTYTPSARGTRTCNVSVNEDGGGGGNVGSFQVRGTGEAPPTIAVSGNNNFGSTRWNDAAPNHTTQQVFTVSNNGDRDLVISNVSFGGMHPGDWSVATAPSSNTIAPGNARNWTLRFDPSAGGNRSATVTFASNDPATPNATFNLAGVGTNAIINVGDVTFGIVNIGSSSSRDITVSNNGASPKGPLGVTSATIAGGNGWFRFTGCGGGASCNFSPDLSINNSTTVAVTCNPPATANANDTEMATVTFSSDTDDAAATPDQVANLSCVAGRSALATNASMVGFGSQLVGTTGTAQMVTVTNTGNVNATFYFQKTGTPENMAAFTVTSGTGCGTQANPCMVLANNGTSTFTVNFTASAEGDTAAGLDLVSSPTPFPQVALVGRGIDRHIETDESVLFPDTFRNPGDMASIMPVTIRNIGEYPLQVTGLSITGDPGVWSLANELDEFSVPGLGSMDVMVKFTPVIAGKAPDATLVVMSDDRVTPMTSIVVSGNGKDRNVSMGPAQIEFSNMGAGVPALLSQLDNAELLSVLNMDDATFKIRSISVDAPDGVFQVLDRDGNTFSNLDLPPAASNQFDIVFLPPTVGTWEGNVSLFLDQDPLAQRTVPIRGNALFVDAHGGGGFGCQTGRSGGAGMLLVLGALWLARRRRES